MYGRCVSPGASLCLSMLPGAPLFPLMRLSARGRASGAPLGPFLAMSAPTKVINMAKNGEN